MGGTGWVYVHCLARERVRIKKGEIGKTPVCTFLSPWFCSLSEKYTISNDTLQSWVIGGVDCNYIDDI